ncbi:MAG: hypothetical protein H6713_31675 [Myxococcales bacterium]|nr:hypothetical protein [Myxococcales bacterium]
MPTTKDQRDIIVDTTESGASVQQLTVNYVAALNNEFGGSVVLDDRAPTDNTCDKTHHELTLIDGAGSKVADVTIRLTVRPISLGGFGGTSEVTSARETSSPAATSGRVRLNGSGPAGWTRTWRQTIQSGGNDVIRNDVKIEIHWELVNRRSYSISQTVTTQTNNTIALAYSITQGRETYATGTISMTAASAAASGYSDGPIIVDDDDD